MTVIFYYNDTLYYKVYKNERVKEFYKYDYEKLNAMSKFVRYRAWGKQMYGKFDNIFLQVSHKIDKHTKENERWIYYRLPPNEKEGTEEQWFGGHDKEKKIFTDEHFNNYFVFDEINGERRYDVPRIETG